MRSSRRRADWCSLSNELLHFFWGNEAFIFMNAQEEQHTQEMTVLRLVAFMLK